MTEAQIQDIVSKEIDRLLNITGGGSSRSKQILKAFRRLIKSNNAAGSRVKQLENNLQAVMMEVLVLKNMNLSLMRYLKSHHAGFEDEIIRIQDGLLEEIVGSDEAHGESNIIALP